MIKVDFKKGKKLYALNFSSFTKQFKKSEFIFRCEMNVVYYKLKDSQLCACLGNIWDYFKDVEAITLDSDYFVKNIDTGRYGASFIVRWDGLHCFGPESVVVQQKIIKLLQPMLDHYPSCPEGYQGWYHFLDS